MRVWDSFETEVEDANELQIGFNADGNVSADATKVLMSLGWIKLSGLQPKLCTT